MSKNPAAHVSRTITKALSRNAAVDAKTIMVIDNDGAVILEGTVSSYAEMLEAERAASSARGVVSVTNRLTINSADRVETRRVEHDGTTGCSASL